MDLKYRRLRMRRRMRKRKKQVAGFSATANKHLDRHVFRRWQNFQLAWRFALGWVILTLILIAAVIVQTVMLGRYYLSVVPVAGGVYTEGLVGSFSNANPIYASNDIDTSVSKLIFSSLLTYDANNKLAGDLATDWNVDDKGTTYTVNLRRDVLWHDGQPFTSDDVVFTFKTISNLDAKSPLRSSWMNVKVEKVNDYQIRFVLPVAYSPFPHSLTVGIIPQHILKKIPAIQLRSVNFNTESPIGTGPFKWQSVSVEGSSDQEQTEIIQLVANDRYYKNRPKLEGVAIKTYPDANALLEALANKQVITAAGLEIGDNDVDLAYNLKAFNLMSANMLFLKTTSAFLNDVKVRQALVKATNVGAMLYKLDYPVISVNSPLLRAQVGYDSSLIQLGFNKAEALQQLDAAGWKLEKGDQYRSKDGKQLVLKLAYENKRDFYKIAETLQDQWAEIGVNLTVDVTQDENDSRKYIDSHDYDVLLYGISIGTDPDVYVYWHSSQIEQTSQTRLNLSEYKSSVADFALEAGRSRADNLLRAAKYKPFLEAWRNDAPAIGLYQPRYLYVSSQHIFGLDNNLINSSSERFNNVHKWMINTVRATQP